MARGFYCIVVTVVYSLSVGRREKQQSAQMLNLGAYSLLASLNTMVFGSNKFHVKRYNNTYCYLYVSLGAGFYAAVRYDRA